MNKSKPVIGIALSGGAGRAASHFGVIDVLKENGIDPDIIVGCSSGALVAVAYGADTKDIMFDQFQSMHLKRMWRMWSFRGARGGLFHFHGADPEFLRITKGLNLEDLPFKIGITAADIETGELVTLTKGNITQALKASIAVPGLFEPVLINNRILLEGGLVNIVPTVPTKQLGADIVIGVDVAKAKFFFQKKMWIFRAIRRWRKIIGVHFVQQGIINPLSSKLSETMEKQFGIKKRRMPNAFRIFFWAVDRSFNIQDEWSEENRTCDIMISPPVRDSAKFELNMADYFYAEGRKTALEAVPKIKALIAEYEKQHQLEKVPTT